MSGSLVQPENTLLPKEVTLEGMLMRRRFGQSMKAALSMWVTVFGSLTDNR